MSQPSFEYQVASLLDDIKDELKTANQGIHAESDMTLRDRFAIAALTALLSTGGSWAYDSDLTNRCYKFADSMLVSREIK